MQFASLLLVTSTLIAPVPAPAPAAPAAGQQRPMTTAASAAVPAHRLGFGGSLSVSNYGVAGSTRYWFSKHVGLSMTAGWYRPRQFGYSVSATPTSSTVVAMPSLMVAFNSSDPSRTVSVRPFVGMGVSYLHVTSQPAQAVGLPVLDSSTTIPVEFGGAEIFFRDHPNFALSAEASYYQLSSQFVNSYYVKGLNFQVSAHFYLK